MECEAIPGQGGKYQESVGATMTHELPPFLQDLLASTPPAGKGVHIWLFRVARQLHAHLPVVEIVKLLESRVAHCGRHVSRKEIEDAVKNSIHGAWQPKGHAVPVQSARKWPPVNQEQRQAVIRDNGGLADLWELSPIRIEDSQPHTEEIIDHLFLPDSLLCCGKSSFDFDTKSREDWRGRLTQLQLIVPSPMTTRTGLTKDGTESAHALSNRHEQTQGQAQAKALGGGLSFAFQKRPWFAARFARRMRGHRDTGGLPRHAQPKARGVAGDGSGISQTANRTEHHSSAGPAGIQIQWQKAQEIISLPVCHSLTPRKLANW